MQAIKNLINKLPHIRGLALYAKHQSVPPGHYYSPIVDPNEAAKYRQLLYDKNQRTFPGIRINEEGQFANLQSFVPFYSEIPVQWKSGGLRYVFENEYYSWCDGILLYSMIRTFKPTRIVEVGSGFSSALMLDTNELFMNNSIELTFVEPYPERLNSLIRKTDQATIHVHPVQDVDTSVFTRLQSNDFLFIDSSHVSKTGSDVNHLFFNILPRLAAGTIVHVHDILHPFEYPEEWVNGNRSWNEAYLLRAFLSFNDTFEIIMYNSFMKHFYDDWLRTNMPDVARNTGGGIWLRKIK